MAPKKTDQLTTAERLMKDHNVSAADLIYKLDVVTRFISELPRGAAAVPKKIRTIPEHVVALKEYTEPTLVDFIISRDYLPTLTEADLKLESAVLILESIDENGKIILHRSLDHKHLFVRKLAEVLKIPFLVSINVHVCFYSDQLAACVSRSDSAITRNNDGSFSIKYVEFPQEADLFKTRKPFRLPLEQINALVTRPYRLVEAPDPSSDLLFARTSVGQPVEVVAIEGDLAVCKYDGSEDKVILPLAYLNTDTSLEEMLEASSEDEEQISQATTKACQQSLFDEPADSTYNTRSYHRYHQDQTTANDNSTAPSSSRPKRQRLSPPNALFASGAVDAGKIMRIDPYQRKACGRCNGSRGFYWELVVCAGNDCPSANLFHLACVGLKKQPGRGRKFYCKDCKGGEGVKGGMKAVVEGDRMGS